MNEENDIELAALQSSIDKLTDRVAVLEERVAVLEEQNAAMLPAVSYIMGRTRRITCRHSTWHSQQRDVSTS